MDGSHEPESFRGQLLRLRGRTIRGHTGSVQALALSADGEILVSGGADGMVRLWDPWVGVCLRSLQAPGRCEHLDITGLTGVTEARRAALLALGAIEAPA
jgi:WD40 repeat protein